MSGIRNTSSSSIALYRSICQHSRAASVRLLLAANLRCHEFPHRRPTFRYVNTIASTYRFFCGADKPTFFWGGGGRGCSLPHKCIRPLSRFPLSRFPARLDTCVCACVYVRVCMCVCVRVCVLFDIKQSSAGADGSCVSKLRCCLTFCHFERRVDLDVQINATEIPSGLRRNG